MDLHFRAFSFVDRITSLQPAKRITGTYSVPSGSGAFPSSLVAEAVGQLAAWCAMAAVEFSHRPVAGLAECVDLPSEVSPGQELKLSADLETVDTDAIAYNGTACVEDRPVLELKHCVGPMMPLEEFDEPDLVRRRFDLLNHTGVSPGGFGGMPHLALQPEIAPSNNSLKATLVVSESADFFADHFPRRAVFPGTLLMHANLQLAALLMDAIARPAGEARWKPRVVRNVKLRSFISPSQTLELEASLGDRTSESANVGLSVSRAGKTAGSCQVTLTPEAAQ